jgi:hypothetical protein
MDCLDPDDGGSKLLRIVAKSLPSDVTHPRKRMSCEDKCKTRTFCVSHDYCLYPSQDFDEHRSTPMQCNRKTLRQLSTPIVSQGYKTVASPPPPAEYIFRFYPKIVKVLPTIKKIRNKMY